MSKRITTNSKLTRPKDEWDTPPEAVAPLARRLPSGTQYIEPCAGRGALIEALSGWGHYCVFAADEQPRAAGIVRLSADGTMFWPAGRIVVITNPPYSRAVVIGLLDAWIPAADEIHLLVPLDWLANQWWAPYAPLTARVIAIGRVSWLGTGKGMENSAWITLIPGAVHQFLIPQQKFQIPPGAELGSLQMLGRPSA